MLQEYEGVKRIDSLTMSDLVHSLLLRLCEIPIRIDRIFLQEKSDLVSRRQEVIIANMIRVVCRELCLCTEPSEAGKPVMK
jgi:hypothetical protein